MAATIAADAGADVPALPFKPILRGLLLTGQGEAVLSAHISGGSGDTSVAEREPTWWPPVKIPGRYLGPYLAGIAAEGHPVRQSADSDP